MSSLLGEEPQLREVRDLYVGCLEDVSCLAAFDSLRWGESRDAHSWMPSEFASQGEEDPLEVGSRMTSVALRSCRNVVYEVEPWLRLLICREAWLSGLERI